MNNIDAIKSAEDILKTKLTVTKWNFLEHVLHSGEVYKEVLSAMEEYAAQFQAEQKPICNIEGMWIDVKDKLPEIRVPVLVYMTYGKIDTCYWTGELWLQSVRIQHSNGDVAHWMPLPTPPNETPKQLSD